jgi:hypothetical protein
MEQCEMGSSPAGAYTTAETSRVENFKHGCQHGNISLLRELFSSQVSWAALNPQRKKKNLTYIELQMK